MHFGRSILLAALALIAFVSPALSTPVVLDNVPEYMWYHGCGPTSMGSLVGYWDMAGLPNLFTASGTDVFLTANVQDQISSPEHNAQYDPTPDRTDLGSHPYNSIACYLGTSVGALDYGASSPIAVPGAFTGYFASRGYSATSTQARIDYQLNSILVSEINAGRPLLFMVDSNADGQADHFVPVVGYDYDQWGTLMYGFYDSWHETETVEWAPVATPSTYQNWGISNYATLMPPFQWKAASGDWSNYANWSAGMPATPDQSAWIDNGGTATMNANAELLNTYVGWYQTGKLVLVTGGRLVTGSLKIGEYQSSSGEFEYAGGVLSVGDLSIGRLGTGVMRVTAPDLSWTVSGKFHVGAAGRFEAQSGAKMIMTGTVVEILSTDPTAMAGMGNLHVVIDGSAGNSCQFEVAGRDLGPTAAGFVGNFALGGLEVSGATGGWLRLVDQAANSGGIGPEAMYVGDLVIGDQARITLGGYHLYYRREGVPSRLLEGDVNFDGAIGVDDYEAILGHLGQAGSWRSGDLNGDGVVTAADVQTWYESYIEVNGQAPAVPEPVMMAWLAVGAAVCRKRRKKVAGSR